MALDEITLKRAVLAINIKLTAFKFMYDLQARRLFIPGFPNQSEKNPY